MWSELRALATRVKGALAGTAGEGADAATGVGETVTGPTDYAAGAVTSESSRLRG